MTTMRLTPEQQRKDQEGRRHLTAALLLPLLLTAALSLNPSPSQAQSAIDFTLNDLDGNPVRLSDLAGDRVVLINFWATWCVPCAKEHPHLQRFQEEYGDEGLTILAINVDGPTTIAGVSQYVSRYGYTFTTLLDSDSSVLRLYNPQVILPFSVLIDRSGSVAAVHQGYSPGDESILEEEIRNLLVGSPGEQNRALSLHTSEALLYRRFTDDGYIDRERSGRSSQIINQLDVTLARPDLLVGARFDSNLDYAPWRDAYRLEKRFLEVNRGRFTARLGDFYHSIGRGLSLSLLKIFEEEGLEHIVDTTIDGGRINFDGGPFSAELFSGIIETAGTSVTDRITGGSLGWSSEAGIEVNLSLLTSVLEQSTLLGVREVSMQTVSVGLPDLLSPFRFYGEFARMQNGASRSNAPTGRGLYLEAGITAWNTSLLVEVKDYRDFDFPWNRPPTLESEDIDILASQFDTELLAMAGFALRIDHYLPAISTLLYGRFSYFDDHPENHPLNGAYRRIGRHGFIGVERRFGNGERGYLNALAGVREEQNNTLVYYNLDGRTEHGQVNVNLPLSSRFSLEADWKGKRFRGDDLRYYENRSFLSLHYSPRLVLTVFMDRSDDPEVAFYEGDRDSWRAMQLEIRITPAASLNIFQGSTKGSVRCSGGVCRYFPPFRGLRIEAILSM
ncbi:redoxin family protein [Gemmatimonadota bacterium]